MTSDEIQICNSHSVSQVLAGALHTRTSHWLPKFSFSPAIQGFVTLHYNYLAKYILFSLISLDRSDGYKVDLISKK